MQIFIELNPETCFKKMTLEEPKAQNTVIEHWGIPITQSVRRKQHTWSTILQSSPKHVPQEWCVSHRQIIWLQCVSHEVTRPSSVLYMSLWMGPTMHVFKNRTFDELVCENYGSFLIHLIHACVDTGPTIPLLMGFDRSSSFFKLVKQWN